MSGKDLEKRWTDFFQEGFYVRAYESRFSKEDTIRDVENVLNLLKPEPGAHFLDWCGGWGRHSIELAKRGFEVTLLDFTPDYIDRAVLDAAEAGVEINTIRADFRKTPADIQADFAINMFTSGLGYLTEEDDLAALTTLHAALKNGAKVLIDTMNLFWIARNYNPHDWRELEGGWLLEDRKFDFLSGRNRSTFTMIAPTGMAERTLEHTIFSPVELAWLLGQTGFKRTSLFGDFEGSEFSFDSRRIVMLAEKV